MMIFTLLLACALPAAFTLPMTSQPTYISPGGNHCFPCPPGTHVSDHCTTDLTDSQCIACPKHHYSEKPNQEKHCTRCRSACPKNGYAARNCSAATNLLCICNDGFHKYPMDVIDPVFECRPHSHCDVGWGEVYSGNFTHDRKCRQCTNSEFVDKSDGDHPICRECTTCSPAMVEVKPCSLDADTECVSNTTSATVTEFTTTSSPQSDGPSGDDNTGAIVGIVFGTLGLLIIIIIIVWCINRRRKRRASGNNSSAQQDEEEPESDEPQEETLFMPNGTAGAMPIPQPPADASSDDPVEWDENFISRDVFRELSRLLGDPWRVFVTHLPGWEQQQGRVQALIQQATMDEHSTPNRIAYCLREWLQDCPDRVTRQNILNTLEEIGARDLVDTFRCMRPNTEICV